MLGHGQETRPQLCSFHLQAVEKLDERNVRLGDRLEEPAFFQESVVFRMADVGKMSVENK